MANDAISQPDYTHMPARLLVQALFVKAGRRVKRLFVPPTRMTWTVQGVSDVDGPTANVRNYIERRTIRGLLARASGGKKFKRACEVGCGYGRLVMTLKEFADEAIGFEREPQLVSIAKTLLPDLSFVNVASLDKLPDAGPFDLAMTVTVLQHLTDDNARRVCAEMRRVVPSGGHVLLIEKNEEIGTTENKTDEADFISRARSVETYSEYMAPFKLIHTEPRFLEPTYFNKRPGTCMLFQGPLIRVCALDFDGVVLESVNVKLEAFRRLFSGHANTPEIVRYLEANNGLDRYTKFRHIWTEMLARPYGPEVEARLDAEFSAMVLEAVLACPFVPGAEDYIRSSTLPLYVVSAMPLRELKIIVEKRGLSARFKGLYGSPGRKADQLQEVIAREKLAPDEVMFVGDSENDRKAAAESGVGFIGRRNAEDFAEPLPSLLPDLRGLSAAIAELSSAPTPRKR